MGYDKQEYHEYCDRQEALVVTALQAIPHYPAQKANTSSRDRPAGIGQVPAFHDRVIVRPNGITLMCFFEEIFQ